MSIQIPMWYLLVVCSGTAYFGFWFGRSRNWGLISTSEKVASQEAKIIEKNKHKTKKNGGTRVKVTAKYGRGVLLSPSAGYVEYFPQNGEWCAKIDSMDSLLISPVEGKVLEIAPRGNAFLIATEWGVSVRVKVCNSSNDLLDRYFRPRVVKGEIVSAGQVLLEYDREVLSRKCTDTAVRLSAASDETLLVESEHPEKVRAGEFLALVC